MPGPAPTYKIELTEQQAQNLSKIAHSLTAPHAEVVRAKILLLAADPAAYTNQSIATQVGCTDRSVRKWRNRWVHTHSLKDAPRPGAPRRFSP